MENGKIRTFRKRCLSLLVMVFLVFAGLMIFGEGCSEVNQALRETKREDRFAKQMELAEDELRAGNLISARTLFEWVRSESKRPSVWERALFFSVFTTFLDTNDKHRWEQGQRMFMGVSEEFPGGEFGQISAYLAAGLSDMLSTMKASKRANQSMRERIDLARSQARELDGLVEKQKKQLLEKTEEIAALKKSIHLRSKEIASLEMKIKKLEEIHKEIKKKREELS